MTTASRSVAQSRLSRWRALGGSAALTARLVIVAVTLVGTLTALALTLVGVGIFALPILLRWHRAQLEGIARAHARLTGTVLPVPEIPAPTGPRADLRWALAVLRNPQTWRLLCWALGDALLGIVIAVAPLGLIAWGIEGLIVLPGLYLLFRIVPSEWYTFIHATSASALPYAAGMGLVLILLGFFTGPWWIRLHGRWARWLLGGESSALRARVEHLEGSRNQARRDAASELRRIEREVHDGTQSQLAAIGLKLGLAEMMMDTEPDRARNLIGEAKADSTTALAELRDLMRGIRPTVLADRGLAAALEALALDATITISTRVSLAAEHDPDLETVVYFAVRELVTNAIKHGNATVINIDATDDTGAAGTIDTNGSNDASNLARTLRVIVSDDGLGGAKLLPGHGLEGIRRRLSVYDGTLTITSPVGGSTQVKIEVPCAS